MLTPKKERKRLFDPKTNFIQFLKKSETQKARFEIDQIPANSKF